MSTFTTAKIEFLRDQPLTRFATVGADGGIDGSSYEVSARDAGKAA
jgi:hypothetical protein